MNKHTPGPWYGKSSAGGGQGLVISEANGANVAVAYDERDTSILAAALDLLAACEAIDGYLGTNGLHVSRARRCELSQQISAAIAKARAAQ